MPDIALDKHSSKPMVVALHSSASSGSQWQSFVADCAEHLEVMAPDLPGYGKSSLTRDISRKGVASVAGPVIELIEQRGKPAHIVGHSNGAAVAIKVAMIRPDLVKSLTLYEPATFHFLNHGSAQDRALFRQISRLAGLVSVSLAFGNPDRGMRAFIEFWNGDGTWSSLPEKARAKFASQSRSIIADFDTGFSERWSLEELRSIAVPTLMMTGGLSPDIARRVASLVASAIPDVRLEEFPELGHMAPVSNPQSVNPAMLKHIATSEGLEVKVAKLVRSAA